MLQKTKRFHVRTILSVTTGRLLTKSDKPRDNGIGDMYELLGWMTSDSPFTHQLGRFAEECKPWLLRWFPELAPCGAQSSIDNLDRWIGSDTTGGEIGVTMWLAEQKMMFPAIKDEYEVPKIPQDDHTRKNAYDELVEMRGTDEGIIVATIDTEEIL